MYFELEKRKVVNFAQTTRETKGRAMFIDCGRITFRNNGSYNFLKRVA